MAIDAEQASRTNQVELVPLPAPICTPVSERGPGQHRISKNFAGLYKVGVGDAVAGWQGAFFLPHVAGVIEDCDFNRGALFIDGRLYEQQYGDTLMDVCCALPEAGRDANAGRRTSDSIWEGKH